MDGYISRYRDNYGRVASDSVTGIRRNNPIGAAIHHTGATNSLDWLSGDSAQSGNPASADWLIDRDGSRHKLTTDTRYAYGVGEVALTSLGLSQKNNPNEYFISYELEYVPLMGPSYAQVDSLAERLVLDALHWRWRWPLRIYAHGGIATPMGRKSDPFLLDWGSLMGRLYVYAITLALPGLQGKEPNNEGTNTKG